MATDWLTTTITGRAQVPLVESGDGPALIFNADPNNTIYMGSDYGLVPGGSNSVPVSPLGTIAVDGNHNVFGVCLPGQTAIVYVVPGGVNFFQLVNILAKSLIVNTGGPTVTGVFVYNGTGAPGNDPILSIVAPGTTKDPYGNTVEAVLTIGDLAGQNVRFDDNGVLYLTNSSSMTSTLYQSADNALGITNPNGLAGFVQIDFQPEVAQYNFTTTSFVGVTHHYAIPANDMNVGTTYRITCHGNLTNGTTGDDSPLWQGNFGGVAGASCEVSSLIGTGSAYGWKVVLEVTCYSTGSGGSIGMSLLATMAAANAEGLIAYGWSITLACDTTVENDFFLQAKWSATTGVPVGASRDNMLERIGP